MANEKISEFTAATILTSAQFSIIQDGINKRASIAVLDERFGQTVVSTSDPTINDDSADGYYPGTRWVNSVTLNEFTCISNTAGAARWRHTPRFWASTAASTTLTGTVSETVLATLSLPAGLPGINGVFEVQNTWLVNNDASGKTASTKLGAAGSGVGATALRSAALASVLTLFEAFTFKNDNSASAQLAFNALSAGVGFGTAAGAQVTAAIDTAAAFDIVWTGTLTDAADSLTLKGWYVRLNRPDISA